MSTDLKVANKKIMQQRKKIQQLQEVIILYTDSDRPYNMHLILISGITSERNSTEGGAAKSRS